MILVSLLNLRHHINSDCVTTALELVGEELINYVHSQHFTDNSCADAQNVCVVVKSRHSCGECVTANCGSDAVVFVGAHRHSDARTANEDAEARVKLRENSLANL